RRISWLPCAFGARWNSAAGGNVTGAAGKKIFGGWRSSSQRSAGEPSCTLARLPAQLRSFSITSPGARTVVASTCIARSSVGSHYPERWRCGVRGADLAADVSRFRLLRFARRAPWVLRMSAFDPLLVVDLEATCWEGEPPAGEASDIIEIGVVLLAVATLEVGE